MLPVMRHSRSCLFRRSYATIQPSPAAGGAISIDSSIYASQTVKSPTSKKSLTHADYVAYYRNNPTMLILQHNNLKQSQLLKIRGELAQVGAKLKVIRVGIFEHAVKVATLQDAQQDFAGLNVNSKQVSVAAKNVRRQEGALSVTELLSGPICAVTFPSALPGEQQKATEVSPAQLKAVMGTIQSTQNKLILLGGRFEGQVFSVDALDQVSTLPGLDTLRGQLLSLLGAPAARLSQLLGTPAQTLGRTMEGRKLALESDDGQAKQE